MTQLTDGWTAVAVLWPLSVLAAAWVAAVLAYCRGEDHVLRHWVRNEEERKGRRREKNRARRKRRKERGRVQTAICQRHGGRDRDGHC